MYFIIAFEISICSGSVGSNMPRGLDFDFPSPIKSTNGTIFTPLIAE